MKIPKDWKKVKREKIKELYKEKEYNGTIETDNLKFAIQCIKESKTTEIVYYSEDVYKWKVSGKGERSRTAKSYKVIYKRKWK